MGIFSRRRASSSVDIARPPSPPRPSTITPSTSSPFLSSPHQSYPLQPQRTNIASSPSTSSVASRVSLRWGRKKTKTYDDGIGGTPYESVPSLPAAEGKRATMMYVGPLRTAPASPTSTYGRAGPSSPLAGMGFQIPNDSYENQEDEAEKRKRLSSGRFRQDGGVLGRLGFENIETTDHPADNASEIQQDPSRDEPETAAEKYGSLEPAAVETEGRVSEEIELLDSADKRSKFWKGMGRGRRISKTSSEIEDDLRSGSPTQRKATLPFASLEPISPLNASTTDLHHPRPQPLRRPSSIFQNPFGRSMSRASLVHPDLDVQTVDDGSFQLRGFRHVSGMSEVESAGQLEGYVHVKRESTVALNQDFGSLVGAEPAGFDRATSPSDALSLRPPLSRPPSVAGSLSSLDDHIMTSSRVSAAAFRKGIRKPSEGQISRSDIGHGGTVDEDDVSLARQSPGFGAHRARSSASVYSISQERDEPVLRANNRPSPSPSPGITFAVHRHIRNGGGSGGFVVKSGRSTKTGVPADNLERSGFNSSKTLFAPSPTVQPSLPPPAEIREIVNTPIIASPIEGYFSAISPAFLSAQRSPPTTPPSGPQPILSSIERLANSSLPTASPARVPPPVEPISLPQPGDKTPASMNLPLPPDEMPNSPLEEPENSLHRSPSPTFKPISPAKGLKVSLLDEPMKLLSGFWPGSSPPEAERVDVALVVDAMRVLSEDQGSTLLQLPDDPPRHPSSTTLFTASAPSADASSRPSLQTRLTNAAAGLSKASLSRLRIADDESADGHATERIASHPSDSGTASPVIHTAPPAYSSFTRTERVRPSASTSVSARSDKKKGWSSSESEEEAEIRLRRVSTRRIPIGPRKQSSVARTVSRTLSQPKATLIESEMNQDSSSEDEPLAVLREKASRSSISLPGMSRSTSGLPPPSPSAMAILATLPLRPGAGSRSPHRPALPPSHSSQSHSSFSRPPSGPVSPSLAIDRLPGLIGSKKGHRSNESPASSQSGLTSESLGQHPMTPREPSIGPGSSEAKAEGHSRDSSKELDGVDLQAWKGRGQGGPPKSTPPAMNARPRRSSLGRPSHWQQPSYPPFVPALMPTSIPPPMDPNVRAMMKQQWQQQYMAAALRASEEEWERASTLSGPATPIGPGTMAGGFPQPHQSMPMYGYPSPHHPMPGMPWAYPFPPMPVPNQGQYNGYASQHNAGYSYGTGARSFFGGEFGPPSLPPSQQNTNAYPNNTQSPDRGRYRDPRGGSNASSPLGRPQLPPSSSTTSTPPI